MNGLTKVNDGWIPLQKKVFTRWVNYQLKGRSSVSIQNITKDLSNGVALVELAIILTGKKAIRSWKRQPKGKIDMVMNCDLAIEMFTKDGVKLIGISGKDISDNNEKLILGLIWSLILFYTIRNAVILDSNNSFKNNNAKSVVSTKNHKQAIMQWANERLSNYPHIKDFSPYGLMLCALLDSYVPEKINYFSLNPKDSKTNIELAEKVMNELNIPVFVDSEEIYKYGNKVDEKTLLTQLSTAKVVLEKDYNDKNAKIRSYIEHELHLPIMDVQECNVIISHPINSDQKESTKESNQNNNDKVSNEVSKFELTSVADYNINQEKNKNLLNSKIDAESQTDSIQIVNSENKTEPNNEDINQNKNELESLKSKYMNETEQLKKELSIVKANNEELSIKLMNSEQFLNQERNRLTRLLSESEKYRKQLETSLSDSEKQLKSKNNYESASSKLSQELQTTKAAVESYQKQIEIAINEKEKAISELQSIKINQANSDASITSIKEELELAAAKIAAKQEENKKFIEEIQSLKISQAKSEANAALFKKALEKAQAEVEHEKEAKQKAFKNAENDKIEANKKDQIENQLKNELSKLKREFIALKAAKEDVEEELKEERYKNCQTASLISSLRIAKEKAEKQAVEFKQDKQKAEAQSEADKKAKLKAQSELREVQAALKRLENKAAIHQEQKIKAINESAQNKKALNRALSNAAALRVAKSKAEEEANAYKELHEKAVAEANQAKIQDQHKSIIMKSNQLEIAKSQDEAEAKKNKEEKEKTEMKKNLEREENEKDEMKMNLEREERVKIEAELEAQKHVNEMARAEIKIHKNAQLKAEQEVARLNEAKNKANQEAKQLLNALSEAQRNAKENEYKNQQALLIAETEAERLGRALVFAESEAKRLSKELELANQKKQSTKKNSSDDIEAEKDARIRAEWECEELSKALTESWKKAKEQGHPIDGNNRNYPKSNFGLTMTLNKSDYNDGQKIDVNRITKINDEKITLALTLVKDEKPFLNSAGLKIDLAKSNVEHDRYQQFTFGKENDDTVINSVVKDSMVWDVADQYNFNPPEGTPFYMFPFHGRHNQHFVYKDGMIYAQQNGQVVTYVGGQVPFVMMAPSQILKDRQTFDIKFF